MTINSNFVFSFRLSSIFYGWMDGWMAARAAYDGYSGP